MTAALAAVAVALAGYWLLVCWRVRVEKGWVGFTQPRTPLQSALLRMRWGFAHVERLIGEALTPAIERAARAIADWSRDHNGPQSSGISGARTGIVLGHPRVQVYGGDHDLTVASPENE